MFDWARRCLGLKLYSQCMLLGIFSFLQGTFVIFMLGKEPGGRLIFGYCTNLRVWGKSFVLGQYPWVSGFLKNFYLLIFFGNRKKFVLFVGLFKDVKEEPQILSQTHQGFCPNTNILSQYPSSLPNLLGIFQKIQFLNSCVCFRSF